MFFRTRHIFLTHVKKLITYRYGMSKKQQQDEMREAEKHTKTYEYPLHFSSYRLKQNGARADTTRSSGRWNVPHRPMERAPPSRKTRENRAERSKCGSAQKIVIFGSTDNQTVNKMRSHKKQHSEAKNAIFRTSARGVRRGRDSHESSDIITLREIEKVNRKPQSANGGRQTIEHSQPRRRMS